MKATIQVLRSEARRLRAVADRLDAFASELDGGPLRNSAGSNVLPQHGLPPHLFSDDALEAYERASNPGGELLSFNSEFHGMTQHAAILKALELYGPQTVRQLFYRLNSGGMNFKKPVYVTAILGRLKSVVERMPDGRIQLKPKASGVGGAVAGTVAGLMRSLVISGVKSPTQAIEPSASSGVNTSPK